MMTPDVNLTQSLGLKPGEKLEPKELTAKIQSMFMEVMIKSMEDSVDAEDGLFGKSASSEIYRGMLNQELAKAMTTEVGTFGESRTQAVKLPPAVPPVRNETSRLELPVAGRLSSQKGWRKDPINGELRFHKGIDIAAPAGTDVKAVADGRVVESGVRGGYGNTVVIQTDDGRQMLYAHNYQNFVQVGDRVTRGETIAQVGSTGRSTGPHVHFEVTE